LHEISVRTAMSARVHACKPDDTLEEVEALMQRTKVRRAPVVEGDRLVGIVSLGDLLVQSPLTSRREPALRPEALVHTLAIISTPNGGAALEQERIVREGVI